MKLNKNKITEALAILSFVWFQVWWVYLITGWNWLLPILAVPVACSIVWTFCISTKLLIPNNKI